MQLTIENLLMSVQMGERSATILARKPGGGEPAFCLTCFAADAGYKSGNMTLARSRSSRQANDVSASRDPDRAVSPSGTRQVPHAHNPGLGSWAGRRHTAILRCKTGAPVVRLSAASMM